MKNRIPTGLWIVALLQFIPPLIVPPTLYKGFGPALIGVIVVVFALLGVNLLRLRPWSRLASIFLQGFNILVRILIMIGGAVKGDEVGGPLDVALLASCTLSIILSAVILYYVDLPDIQVIMQ